ncbi:hypothetical protein MMC07_008931 [Pseudocyphellaria aurata]|nr:hypothetical protein [Pseudocyphellaria aurata]
MKVYSYNCTFDYSWEEVSTANWRKYCPWNKSSSHVVAVDTLSRIVDPSTGILRTERLITCTQTAPAWVLALLGGSNTSHVYETSYVSPTAKSVTMCSMNLTWNNVLSVRETVVYKPDTTSSKSGPERTQLNQYAEITALCGGIKKVKSKIEEASIERFEQNAQRGREGFEAVLEMSRRVFGEEREQQNKSQLT